MRRAKRSCTFFKRCGTFRGFSQKHPTRPLSTDLSLFSQAELDAIAARLNSRPRKTLSFETPDEVFARLVDKTVNAVTSRNVEGVRYGT
jgi:hypothetical protein